MTSLDQITQGHPSLLVTAALTVSNVRRIMIYQMELVLGDAWIATLSTPLFLGNVNGARFNKETIIRAG